VHYLNEKIGYSNIFLKTLPTKIQYNLWHLRAYLPISMDRNYQPGNRHENGDVANELSAEECVL